jgi:mRNA-degrading endonuclease toxin of MazEF toxin-antitoxin module
VKFSRGDVVLLDFPFSDATGSKVRPAIVVQGDAQNRRLNAMIVTLVTKDNETDWSRAESGIGIV